MCYSAKSLLTRKLLLAIRNDASAEEIDAIAEKLRIEEERHSHHHVSAFTHPKLLTQTNEANSNPQLLEWGLIPFWCKDEKQARELQSKTINARGETIFEKPSFKESANEKRCVIVIDGFYEYMTMNKKKYPFYVALKDGPMRMAGLWSEWKNQAAGEDLKSITIVTTVGNEMMEIVHNLKNRMPVILEENEMEQWLKGNRKEIQELIKPLASNKMQAHSTRPLIGKSGVGDVEEASEEYQYPELAFTYMDIESVIE